MYLLKVSGFIQPEKAREFIQSFQQLLAKKPHNCVEFGLYTDVSSPSLHSFFTLFPDRESLEEFRHSQDYRMLLAAFKVLGFIKDEYVGELKPLGDR